MVTYNTSIDRTGADSLIPVKYANEIIKDAVHQSAALQLMRTIPMSTKTERLPVLTALPQAYWVTGDTGLKQTSKETWEGKILTAEEIAVIVPVPQAVLDDSTFDIWGQLRPDLTAAIGAAIDQAVIFGVNKPASFATAIVPDAIAHGNTLAAGAGGSVDTAMDVSNVMALVEADGFNVNGFAADITMKGKLRNLRDDNNQVIFLQLVGDTGAGGPTRLLYDTSLYYVNNGSWFNNTALLVAGDWSKGIIGIRQDITVSLHSEGVISDGSGAIVLNLMQQDSAAIRVVMRVGFVTANPVTQRASAEATRFPFAVLTP